MAQKFREIERHIQSPEEGLRLHDAFLGGFHIVLGSYAVYFSRKLCKPCRVLT